MAGSTWYSSIPGRMNVILSAFCTVSAVPCWSNSRLQVIGNYSPSVQPWLKFEGKPTRLPCGLDGADLTPTQPPFHQKTKFKKTSLDIISSVFAIWLKSSESFQMEGVGSGVGANKSPLSLATGAVNNPVCDPGEAFESAAHA